MPRWYLLLVRPLPASPVPLGWAGARLFGGRIRGLAGSSPTAPASRTFRGASRNFIGLNVAAPGGDDPPPHGCATMLPAIGGVHRNGGGDRSVVHRAPALYNEGVFCLMAKNDLAGKASAPRPCSFALRRPPRYRPSTVYYPVPASCALAPQALTHAWVRPPVVTAGPASSARVLPSREMFFSHGVNALAPGKPRTSAGSSGPDERSLT